VRVHLKTARLILRRLTVADEDNLVNLNSDSDNAVTSPSRRRLCAAACW
jgi:hypothetical protein